MSYEFGGMKVLARGKVDSFDERGKGLLRSGLALGDMERKNRPFEIAGKGVKYPSTKEITNLKLQKEGRRTVSSYLFQFQNSCGICYKIPGCFNDCF